MSSGNVYDSHNNISKLGKLKDFQYIYKYHNGSNLSNEMNNGQIKEEIGASPSL